ncbi:Abi family protein [Halomonas alkalisoli]|uniref:Abi family protein n=1 Tax=Halomonas alkalisoli TaxID=2907158 RepID=UPI001F3071B5|nr:Abi family protein [Halomonas alkalisoli]MCE9681134.1 Abi family protein [Halomonas alkalisoli]
MSDFHKPAHSIKEQIATLSSRGLVIPDEARVHHYLANISYFRLSAYTRPFYQPGRQEHCFLEGTSFKEVSTLLAKLRVPEDTQRIERHFDWKMPVLRSWFRSLSDLRNVCAHHGRVWNREFGSRPEMPRKIPAGWPSIPVSIETGSHEHPEQRLDPRRRLYLQLVVIESMMQVVSPTSQWAERLVSLLDHYPQVSRPHMGFPGHWDTEPFWRDAVMNAREGLKG